MHQKQICMTGFSVVPPYTKFDQNQLHSFGEHADGHDVPAMHSFYALCGRTLEFL
jgi:hypothetical protein